MTKKILGVADVMTRSVVTVEMDDDLRVVKEIFENIRFHHLLVVNEKRLLGVISDRDLFKSLSPYIGTAAETARDMASLNKKAHQIMTRKPVTLTPTADIYKAISLFNTHSISCIPIVDKEHVIQGILSWRDVFRVLESKRK